MSTKRTTITLDLEEGTPRPENVRDLIRLFSQELANAEGYKKDTIRTELLPLVKAYAGALESGEAETVALVQLQGDSLAAKSASETVALERFKVRAVHWTIRFAIAVVGGAAWAVFA